MEVRTGEAVALRYELAGLGSRFLAVSIDMAAQLA
ncbi:MAG: RDD family protein, partial [Candidatus Eremiobacteraeota bacterium]|nr:RDD family protein [Candidatus Eremiobacteraeota bacterium]